MVLKMVFKFKKLFFRRLNIISYWLESNEELALYFFFSWLTHIEIPACEKIRIRFVNF